MVGHTHSSLIRQVVPRESEGPCLFGGDQVSSDEGRRRPHRGGRCAHPGVAISHEDVHGRVPAPTTWPQASPDWP